MEKKYTFKLSENVTRTHVIYKNRFGIKMAADIYKSKSFDEAVNHPALVIGPPYGGSKEQSPGIYANQLAQRGFVVLAIDPAFNGDSEGETRHLSSPEMFAEGFSAGVDYLGTVKGVDREKIGAIGICGSGGFALSAAAMDSRIKAVATASMYDIGVMFESMSPTPESRKDMIDKLSRKRWDDFENGVAEYIPSFPYEPLEVLPEGLDPIMAEFFSYYGLKRGHHPNALGNFTTTSQLSFLNYSLLSHIDTIAPRPILMIIGDNAHSKTFSENAYIAASEPKELYIVADCIHIDLYDKLDKIPFNKIELFFKNALK